MKLSQCKLNGVVYSVDHRIKYRIVKIHETTVDVQFISSNNTYQNNYMHNYVYHGVNPNALKQRITSSIIKSVVNFVKSIIK